MDDDSAAVYNIVERDEQSNELEAALDEIGNVQNSFIKVERMREGKPPEYVHQYAADGFSLGLLQDHYGGGEYRLTGRCNGKYKFRRTVSVAQPKPKPATHPETASSVANNQDVLAGIAELMRQQSERMNGQMMQMFMLMNRSQQSTAGPDRMEVLRELQVMKEIFGGNSDAYGPERGLDLIKQGIEFGKEIVGGETSNMDVLLKGMDAFAGPLADALRISNEEKQKSIVTNAADKPKEAKQVQHPMKMQLAFLVRQAAGGANPELYAELVMDHVSQDQLKQFFAGSTDPIDALAKIDPRVAHHRPWFELLIKEIVNLMDEDNVDSTDTSGVTETDHAID